MHISFTEPDALMVTAGKESVAASFSVITRRARLYGCTDQAEGTTPPPYLPLLLHSPAGLPSGPALKRICTGHNARSSTPVASALLKKAADPLPLLFLCCLLPSQRGLVYLVNH